MLRGDGVDADELHRVPVWQLEQRGRLRHVHRRHGRALAQRKPGVDARAARAAPEVKLRVRHQVVEPGLLQAGHRVRGELLQEKHVRADLADPGDDHLRVGPAEVQVHGEHPQHRPGGPGLWPLDPAGVHHRAKRRGGDRGVAAGPRRLARRNPSAAHGAAAATCGVTASNGTAGFSARRIRSTPTTLAVAHAASPPATTQDKLVTFDPTPGTTSPYDLPGDCRSPAGLADGQYHPELALAGHMEDPMSHRHPIFARYYARVSRLMEDSVGPYRQRLVDGVSGRVIEVGAGNGLNFPRYPATVTEVIAVEPEPHLRSIAEANAARAPSRSRSSTLPPTTCPPTRPSATPRSPHSSCAASPTRTGRSPRSAVSSSRAANCGSSNTCGRPPPGGVASSRPWTPRSGHCSSAAATAAGTPARPSSAPGSPSTGSTS